MTSNTDIFLKIGDNHKVCEDYVLCGEASEGRKFLIVSDGCSSSKNTDMGSRIIAHVTKKFLMDRFADNRPHEMPEAGFMGSAIIHSAKLAASMLRMNTACLDATLVIGILDPVKNWFYVYAYGDMAILTKYSDEKLQIIDIEYTSEIESSQNAPYYLSYQLDDLRDIIYHDMKIDKIIRTRTKYKGGTEVIDDTSRVAYDYVHPIILDANQIKSILICSDGFSSFIQPGENGMVKSDPCTIAQEFTSFKNFRGEFLKRRIKRALSDLEQTYKASHYDDLSIGAITFEE